MAEVLRVLEMPDGSTTAILQGRKRMALHGLVDTEPYLNGTISLLDDQPAGKDDREYEALISTIKDLTIKMIEAAGDPPRELVFSIRNMQNTMYMLGFACCHIVANPDEKQELLAIGDVKNRAYRLLFILNREYQLIELKTSIQMKTHEDINKQQKEYFLQQQMKAIQEELGGNMNDIEIRELRAQAKKKKWPKEVGETFEKELAKLERIHPQSPDYSIQSQYVQTIVGLPWGTYSRDNFSLTHAQRVLDRDHYGMEKVKERILEYLAVQQRVDKVKAPILCLVGPPGVGKTSLGQSIARATNRKFVRMALGGVRDEAEIRGHRRTYIGSMPGKILQSITKVGVRNPLFLLDEVDKMGQDFRGDPASALLEVLDPEQNDTFADHYVEVDYDLSDVMFVATANSFNIPAPLLDRMEVIRLSGYTEDEKVSIAQRYLLPKQIRNNGLKAGELTVSEAVLRDILRFYTREAGVRSLERELSKICRKAVKALLLDKSLKGITVTAENLDTFLGVRRYTYGIAEKNNQVGQVNGLAWTEVGGELLTIEAIAVPGKGKNLTTGKLGDVMQESIKAAMTVVRRRAAQLGIKPDFYEKQDIHVHVPEGATPKDGPSAGIAMTTALVSVLTGIPVRADVAMTGEITLRGEVLAIGGLKEKLLAAQRAGIKLALIPEENVKDLAEIPDNVKNSLEIVPVKWIDKVLELALVHRPQPLPEEGEDPTSAPATPPAAAKPKDGIVAH